MPVTVSRDSGLPVTAPTRWVDETAVESIDTNFDGAKADKSSWLCPDGFDRARMLDMEERLLPVRRRAAVIMALAILAAGPWLGWWPLIFVVSILSGFSAADRLMPRLARPEFLMFGAWVCSELTIALAVALSGNRGAPALSLMAIPAITLSSRFSMRGVVLGVIISIGLALLVAFGVDKHPVLANPVLVIMPVALILCAAVLSTPLMSSDIQHRSDAVIDQLTGLLNRNALTARVRELAQQSAVTCEPVGVIVGDIDNFKRVNDTRGHTVGDAVLKEVAYVWRKQLRAFDLAYRIGGEEFVILLPGSGVQLSAELAERLHDAVSAQQLVSGVSITMSFGVDASRQGERFDYARVFAQADAALYEAKHSGRDRICLARRDRSLALA
jgi:diguanylate cyclase (GGDEF)-like protein